MDQNNTLAELQWMQRLFNTVSSYIYVYNAREQRNVYANRNMGDILGYTPEELRQMGNSLLETIMHPDDFAQLPLIFQHLQAAADGETVAWEYRVRGRTGEWIWLQDHMTVFSRDGQGNLVEYVGTVQDITARKQQEEALQMFKAMADTAPDGFGIADHNGVLTYANTAYRAMTGYGDDLIGMRFIDHFSPERQPEAITAITETSTRGEWRGLLHFQRPEGTQIPVESTGFVTRDPQGNINAVMGLFRDITEQQRSEQERAMLQQRIIDTQRDTLRELSTPLIPISDEVVIMPLIGTIDSNRAQMVMEALLEGIAQHQADLVILDITGVSLVDTQVAQAFIQAAQAVRLLGAQVMLTGIGPQIAQTLVTLGVDLGEIITYGSLQAGIAAALIEQ